jgi:hypothetical protein
MQVDQGLLRGLKHLCLHSQHLLKSKQRGWRWVGFLVVALPIVFSIVGRDTVPCVRHLRIDEIKNTQKNGGRGKGIVVNPQR